MTASPEHVLRSATAQLDRAEADVEWLSKSVHRAAAIYGAYQHWVGLLDAGGRPEASARDVAAAGVRGVECPPAWGSVPVDILDDVRAMMTAHFDSSRLSAALAGLDAARVDLRAAWTRLDAAKDDMRAARKRRDTAEEWATATAAAAAAAATAAAATRPEAAEPQAGGPAQRDADADMGPSLWGCFPFALFRQAGYVVGTLRPADPASCFSPFSAPSRSRAGSTSRGSSAPVDATCAGAHSGRTSPSWPTPSARSSPPVSGCVGFGCLCGASRGASRSSWALSSCCRSDSTSSIYCKKCQ